MHFLLCIIFPLCNYAYIFCNLFLFPSFPPLPPTPHSHYMTGVRPLFSFSSLHFLFPLSFTPSHFPLDNIYCCRFIYLASMFFNTLQYSVSVRRIVKMCDPACENQADYLMSVMTRLYFLCRKK